MKRHEAGLLGTLVAMVLAMTLGITQGERAGRRWPELATYNLHRSDLFQWQCAVLSGCWKQCCPVLGGQRVLALQAGCTASQLFHTGLETFGFGTCEVPLTLDRKPGERRVARLIWLC